MKLRLMRWSAPRAQWRLFSQFALMPAVLLALLPRLCVQAAPPPKEPKSEGQDVIVFTTGDRLTGRFLRAVKGKAVFHSDLAGDLTVPWEKVNELRTETLFVPIPKNLRLSGQHGEQQLPAGKIRVQNQQLTTAPDQGRAGETIPLKELGAVIDRATYLREIRHESNPLSGWKGTATAGATVVAATQRAYSFNFGLSMARAIPTVDWLDKRNRSLIEFQSSYGRIAQDGEETVKSAIYHAAAERDEYFSQHLYALAQTSLDHNYSQGLDLQQIYGGGIGRSFLMDANQSFDAKATVQYTRQNFLSTATNSDLSLVGSTFSANYTQKFSHGISIAQQLSYIPAWNELNAYSLTETNTLALPISKRLSFSLGTIDSYMNRPAETTPPTRRNSFQFTMGARFAFQ